ncbi:dihydroneopterin aldolase [Parapedobacter koreensis]|uniref:7,8-dihydroneopterin aldolase n=1 Tax=Parapedobacter koreensis TaxID=332977 RepID=A0A1H7MYC1_9SPHI|nr:dihydroneopterin aldolase [Parapedobacter koreensis]SEL16039.1 dihydroneopterin aldolase [Parapedobacter koreensis]
MGNIQQTVALTALRFYAYHGYYPEEQVLGNEFTVAIRVKFDKQHDGQEDLQNTVNYETLYTIAKTEMQQSRKLLETVAEAMLGRIRKDFPVVSEIEVSICKNHPPFGGDHAKAAVSLTWEQDKMS